MMDDCPEVRFHLLLLRRGELDAAEAEPVRAHLARCPDCAAELEAELALDRRLSEEKPAASAPSELRTAVTDLIARAGRGRRWRHALAATARRPLVAAALGVAATLLVVGPAAFLVLRARQADPLAVPLAEAVAGYRRSALEQQVGRPDDVEKALAELQQHLGVPTTTAFKGDAELTLVAVEPALVLGRPGALLTFRRRDGRLVALQIVRAPDVQIPRERGTPIGPFRPVLKRQDDLSAAVWKQGNAFYALSAPVSEAEMAQIYLRVRQGTTNPT
jgi:anti-sigma factor RsiW